MIVKLPGGSLRALAKTPKHYPLNCEIGVYNFSRRLRAPALFTRALVCFMKKVVAPVCHFITGGKLLYNTTTVTVWTKDVNTISW